MKPTMEIADNGTKRWILNGKYHREDGPAIENADGTKRWYINALPHREDGPAIEWADGTNYWYLNGKQLSTMKEFQRKSKLTDADMTALVLRYGQI